MSNDLITIINNLVNDHDNYWIPAYGYKWVSNGEIWTDGIYLGKNDTIERWYGTNEDPPPLEDEEEDDI